MYLHCKYITLSILVKLCRSQRSGTNPDLAKPQVRAGYLTLTVAVYAGLCDSRLLVSCTRVSESVGLIKATCVTEMRSKARAQTRYVPPKQKPPPTMGRGA